MATRGQKKPAKSKAMKDLKVRKSSSGSIKGGKVAPKVDLLGGIARRTPPQNP